LPIAQNSGIVVDKYYLYPGDIFSNKTPHIIDTVLGSCVSVFLWDAVLKFGSVNHYMLPHGSKGNSSFKYGSIAIPELLNRMQKMGSTKKNIRAKIFGGSDISNTNNSFGIGKRNIGIASDLLKAENIPVISFSVGGPLGRKVIFHSSTGNVLISYIKRDIKTINQQNTHFNFLENE